MLVLQGADGLLHFTLLHPQQMLLSDAAGSSIDAYQLRHLSLKARAETREKEERSERGREREKEEKSLHVESENVFCILSPQCTMSCTVCQRVQCAES